MFKRFKNRKQKRGSVTVEFALVAPIFFLFVFSGVEFARVHILQNAVENACFEAARRGIVPGASGNSTKVVAEEFLTSSGIADFTVEVNPPTFDPTTTTISVTASVPINAENGFGISGFFNNQSMTKEVSLPIQRN